MKSLIIALALVFSAGVQQAAAQQMELPLQHPDEVLLKAYPGEPNVQLADFAQFPAKVKETFIDADIAFEMGDGYYDPETGAYYKVFDSAGHLVGYMEVQLLSYTEDPDLFLSAVYVNLQGNRLEAELVINVYSDADDETLKQLPPELQLAE